MNRFDRFCSKRKLKMTDITDYIVTFFMFAVMFIPSSYKKFRLMLLVLLTFFVVMDNHRNIFINKNALNIFTVYIAYGIISFLNGVINKAPGAVPTLRTSLLWPVIYMVIGLYFAEKSKIIRLCKVMLIIEFIVCIFDIWYCLSNISFISFPDFFMKLDLEYSFNRYGVVYRFTTKHMVTHIFMIPFTVALFLGNTIFSKKKLTILLFLEFVVFLFAGRVALQLGVIIVSFLMFFIVPRKKKSRYGTEIIKTITCFFCISGVFYFTMKFMGYGIDNYIENITTKLITSISVNSSNQARQSQVSALLKGWLDSPLLGNGLGSYAKESIRDSNVWAYEMSYHAMLFQQGILGVVTFFALPIYSMIRILKLYKMGYITLEMSYPFIAGLISILLGNSVDPYLSKMGCLWILFFPFSIAAYCKEGEVLWRWKFR